METPKKNNGDNKKYAQSEKSDFSTTHLKLHDQIYEENERLKKQIKTLEDKLNQQELGLFDFQDQMNKIQVLQPPEGLSADSLEFLKIKINAYEKIVPPTFSYPLQIFEPIFLFNCNELKESSLKKINEMKGKLEKISKTLISMKKKVKILKINNPPTDVLPSADLVIAFNDFKEKLNQNVFKEKKQKIDDLIFSDSWRVKLELPLQDIKNLLFFSLQAEEIAENFFENLIKTYLHLKSNLMNFQKMVEIFPSQFILPERLKQNYSEIVKRLKIFNETLKHSFPELLNLKNYADILLTQETLKKIMTQNKNLMNEGDSLQDKINSLTPDLENHIKDIFKKIKVIRGAQVICSE